VNAKGNWYRWVGDDLLLEIHAQPGARKDEVVGPHGDALKIRIAAPPIDGRANDHLVRFMAGLCGVPRARITVERGQSGRRKRLRISDPEHLPDGVERD